jgi:hypothetical protein
MKIEPNNAQILENESKDKRQKKQKLGVADRRTPR